MVCLSSEMVTQMAESTVFDLNASNGGGGRFDGGKAPVHMVDPILVTEVAKVLHWAATRKSPPPYPADNWRKGMAWTRVVSSALRHAFDILRGEDFDAESGLPHWAHLGCNVMFGLRYLADKIGVDDRYRGETPALVSQAPRRGFQRRHQGINPPPAIKPSAWLWRYDVNSLEIKVGDTCETYSNVAEEESKLVVVTEICDGYFVANNSVHRNTWDHGGRIGPHMRVVSHPNASATSSGD